MEELEEQEGTETTPFCAPIVSVAKPVYVSSAVSRANCAHTAKLFLCLVVWIILGGLLFSALERESEQKNYAHNVAEAAVYRETVKNLTRLFGSHEKGDQLSNFFNKHAPVVGPPPQNWDFFGSLFFSFMLVTTLGYVTPLTTGGKAAVCTYGTVGIIFTYLCLGSLVDLSEKLFRAKISTWIEKQKIKPVLPKVARLLAFNYLCLLALCVVAIFVSTTYLLAYLEHWGLADAAFITFINVSTIGFGDVLPANAISELVIAVAVFCELLLFCVGAAICSVMISITDLPDVGSPAKYYDDD